MRKLASIQRIVDILPIEGADAIEVVRCLGWRCVVKKEDSFSIGDLVVYAEVDSVFPQEPQFEFLQHCKYRIRTMKLRGQISQGLVLPLSILPRGDYREGDDVSELIGVVKYDPPEPAHISGDTKGSFPSFMPKTDETRIQVLQDLLTKYKGTKMYYAEKLDGASESIFLNNHLDPEDRFGVCSRSQELKRSDNNSLWKMVDKYNIENNLKKLNRNIALQGEIIGEGIQSNKYKLKGQDFYVFNIFDINNYRYLDFDEFMQLASLLNLKTVPILNKEFILTDNIDELVELAKGYSVLNKQTKREGIVIRPLVEIDDPKFGRISFKSINPEFLIKYSSD